MAGFKGEEVRGLRVETAAQVRQDFQLQVGAVSETVEVMANAATLTTETASVGGVIENKRIIELPLNGRNVVSLAVLIPGVQFGYRTGQGDGLSASFPIPGAGFSVSANGIRETFQVVSLDGVDAKDPRIHITNFVPSVEALEEFRIQTNAYSAENGFGGGAVVNMTMKTGTNGLHGTLFEFLRNDKFDAEDYFLNQGLAPGAARSPKNKLRRNQFGVVVSGPLVKNKTFWAFDYEGRREVVGTVATAWFPEDAFRAGDFSQLLKPPINPATGKIVRAPIIIFDANTGMPYPGNIIPTNRIHPGAKNVIDKFLPHADFQQTDPLDFTARKSINTPITANQYFGRVDHYFRPSDRIFGRIAADRSEYDNNTINPNFPVFTPSHVTNLASQWVHTFNQSILNEFRFGFNISNDTLTDLHNQGNFDVDSLGIGQFRAVKDGNRPLTPREQGVPTMGFTIGDRVNGNGLDRMNTYQISDHVSVFRGSHALKMGAEVYRISMQRAGANAAQGAINFSANESGLDFASFLLGLPNNTLSPEGEPQTFPRATRIGTYINDDWKVTPRLTVNLGLRWDHIGVPYDAKALWRTFDLPGYGTDVGRGKGYQTPNGQVIPTIYPSTLDSSGAMTAMETAPRNIHAARRPGLPTDRKVGDSRRRGLVRQHRTPEQLDHSQPDAAEIRQSGHPIRYRCVPDHPGRRTPTAPSPMSPRAFIAPAVPVLTLSDPFQAKTPPPTSVVMAPPDVKDGDVWKWNFDLQRELPGSIAWTIGYVGNKGSHNGNSIGNYNDALPSSNTDVQSRRPYQQYYDPALPQFGIQTVSTIRYLDSYGNSFYHALQTKIDKRFAARCLDRRGLYVQQGERGWRSRR